MPELVSTTTREPRQGEVPGKDYHFVTVEELPSVDFIESVEYAGNYYGMTYDEITRVFSKADKAVVVTEYTGVLQLKERLKGFKVNDEIIEVISIGVYSLKHDLSQRMRDRGDSEEVILKRLKLVDQELNNVMFAQMVVVNTQGYSDIAQHMLGLTINMGEDLVRSLYSFPYGSKVD